MLKHWFRLVGFILVTVGLALGGCSRSRSAVGSAELVASIGSQLSSADVTTVTISVSGVGVSTPITANLVRTGNTWRGTIGEIPVGSDRLFDGKAFDGQGHVVYLGQAHAAIAANVTAAVVLTLQQATPPPPFANAAPVIDSIVASSLTTTPSGAVSLKVTAHDPNGDALTYGWSASGGSFTAAGSAATTFTAPAVEGPQVLTIQVSDPSGAKATASLTVQVGQANGQGAAAVSVTVNTWPIVANVNASVTRVDVGQGTVLTVVSSDADADPLAYQWSASCAGSFNDATAAQPTFTLASLPVGNTCTLTVLVSDGRGGVDTGALTIATGTLSSTVVAPQLDSSFQSQASAGGGVALQFAVSAHDPQGLALTFAWSANTGVLSGQTDGAGASQVTWTSAACSATAVQPTISVAVTDSASASTTKTFAVTSTCANCSDGIKNGAESDVDCGGPSCGACAVGKTCSSGADCASAACSTVCLAATCSDGVKNGAETATDCGGGVCSACANGKACAAPADCVSSVCAANVCASATCSDGLKNGAETAVDCGGPACSACSNGSACAANTDCTSGVCSSNVCAAASCNDGLKNGAETDVDCGGPNCAACALAKSCAATSDCLAPSNASAACVSGKCALAACGAGFYDCDLNQANGCETASSVSNCNACGNACAAGQTCQSATCVSPAWSQVTAVAGTPVSVAIGPNTGGTPYRIYVATSGNGIYSSTDGATWTNNGPASTVAVASMPQANSSFASLADGTVQITQNGATSWASTVTSPNAVLRAFIGISGVGPLGATTNATGSALVLQGKSSGASWVASSPFGTGVATSLAYGGGASPNYIVYAAVNGTGGGVFKSTNVGGASFSFATTGFPQTQVLSVATAASALGTVFAGTNGQGAGVYVSTDAGANWTAAGTGLGNTVVQALAVDPTNPNNVYAGTAAGAYVSKNGGASWAASGLGTSSVTSLAVLNGTPSTVYAATSAGLYVTSTGGL